MIKNLLLYCGLAKKGPCRKTIEDRHTTHPSKRRGDGPHGMAARSKK